MASCVSRPISSPRGRGVRIRRGGPASRVPLTRPVPAKHIGPELARVASSASPPGPGCRTTEKGLYVSYAPGRHRASAYSTLSTLATLRHVRPFPRAAYVSHRVCGEAPGACPHGKCSSRPPYRVGGDGPCPRRCRKHRAGRPYSPPRFRGGTASTLGPNSRIPPQLVRSRRHGASPTSRFTRSTATTMQITGSCRLHRPHIRSGYRRPSKTNTEPIGSRYASPWIRSASARETSSRTSTRRPHRWRRQ